MKQKIYLILVTLTVLATPFYPAPVYAVTTVTKNYIDCGTFDGAVLTFSGTGLSSAATTQDKVSAKCMSDAFFKCQPAKGVVIDTESKDTTIPIIRIEGLDGSLCKIYLDLDPAHKIGTPPHMCTAPLTQITQSEQIMLNDPTQKLLRDNAFYGAFYILAAFTIALGDGKSSSSSPSKPNEVNLDLKCQAVDSSLVPLTVSLNSAYPASASTGSMVTLYGKNLPSLVDVLYEGVSGSPKGSIVGIGASSDGAAASFTIPATMTPGSYKLSVHNDVTGISNSVSFKVDLSPPSEIILTDPIPIHVPTGDAHAIGTNFVAPNGVVYRVMGGPLRAPYSSANVFLSYKFNKWSEVVPATSGDMGLDLAPPLPPRDGSLINDKGTVYIVTDYDNRAPFASADVFKGYGYSFKNVYPLDSSYLKMYPNMTSSNLMHPDGTLIKDHGTYYAMNSHARLAFPSVAILESWGYWLSEAVPANSYDMASPINAIMVMRPANLLRY